MKYKEIIKQATECNNSVKKLQKLGTTYKMSYYFAKALLTKNDVKDLNFKTTENPTGDHISRQISKASYVGMAKRLVKYVEENKQIPNYLGYGKIKVSPADSTYMFARTLLWQDKKGYLASKINVNSKAFEKKTEDTDNVYAYFIKTFGSVKTFIEALTKIQGKGYGFYFDDKLSNIQVIDGLAHRTSNRPNCVDICQMMWHVAKGLGYDVRCLHVYCPVDKITHVRLQVKHKTYTKGEWENYDPAAVAKGSSVRTLWCSGAGSYIIATNPNWFLANVNR